LKLKLRLINRTESLCCKKIRQLPLYLSAESLCDDRSGIIWLNFMCNPVNLGYLAIATIILRMSAMTWITVELFGTVNRNSSIRRNKYHATRNNMRCKKKERCDDRYVYCEYFTFLKSTILIRLHIIHHNRYLFG